MISKLIELVIDICRILEFKFQCQHVCVTYLHSFQILVSFIQFASVKKKRHKEEKL